MNSKNSKTFLAQRKAGSKNGEFGQKDKKLTSITAHQGITLNELNFLMVYYQEKIYLGHIYRDEQGNKHASLVQVNVSFPKQLSAQKTISTVRIQRIGLHRTKRNKYTDRDRGRLSQKLRQEGIQVDEEELK